MISDLEVLTPLIVIVISVAVGYIIIKLLKNESKKRRN